MKSFIYVFPIVFSSFVYAQDTYLCIPSSATGFSFTQKTSRWEESSFNIEEKKFLLKKKTGQWQWSNFGETNEYTCQERGQTSINCNLFLGEVIFDKKTLRYLKTYLPGYVDGVESNANTPHIMIGKCSPL